LPPRRLCRWLPRHITGPFLIFPPSSITRTSSASRPGRLRTRQFAHPLSTVPFCSVDLSPPTARCPHPNLRRTLRAFLCFSSLSLPPLLPLVIPLSPLQPPSLQPVLRGQNPGALPVLGDWDCWSASSPPLAVVIFFSVCRSTPILPSDLQILPGAPSDAVREIKRPCYNTKEPPSGGRGAYYRFVDQ
jgi:hypothetical protein